MIPRGEMANPPQMDSRHREADAHKKREIYHAIKGYFKLCNKHLQGRSHSRRPHDVAGSAS